jgi:hypothetical protein
LYRDAIAGNVSWLPRTTVGTSINFSEFYNLDSFVKVINSLQEMPEHQLIEIWKHFMQGQESIITRVRHYNDICNDIVANQTPSIPEYFDNVDYGIMCGMIYCSTNRDLLNLSSDTWI